MVPFWAAPVGGKTDPNEALDPVSEGDPGASGMDTDAGGTVQSPTTQSNAANVPDNAEQGEEPPVRVKVPPLAPSREEYEKHVVTHYPYRSWCRHCVAGAGRRDGHASSAGVEHMKPLISIDYGFLSEDPGEHAAPILACYCSKTQALFGDSVPEKGENEYAVKVLKEHLVW